MRRRRQPITIDRRLFIDSVSRFAIATDIDAACIFSVSHSLPTAARHRLSPSPPPLLLVVYLFSFVRTPPQLFTASPLSLSSHLYFASLYPQRDNHRAPPSSSITSPTTTAHANPSQFLNPKSHPLFSPSRLFFLTDPLNSSRSRGFHRSLHGQSCCVTTHHARLSFSLTLVQRRPSPPLRSVTCAASASQQQLQQPPVAHSGTSLSLFPISLSLINPLSLLQQIPPQPSRTQPPLLFALGGHTAPFEIATILRGQSPHGQSLQPPIIDQNPIQTRPLDSAVSHNWVNSLQLGHNNSRSRTFVFHSSSSLFSR